MAKVPRRLAVLGDPIAHSKSPKLHRAAYAVLGLDWHYDAVRVGSGELPHFLASTDETWLGLSLTMPLKREVLPLLTTVDSVANVVGAANTVLFSGGQLGGFNTDVFGITAALREAGIPQLGRVRILGSGATAASVLAAVAELGADDVAVSVRSHKTTAPLVQLAERLGVHLRVEGFSAEPLSEPVDVVISTLPGGAGLVQEFSEGLRDNTPLVDIAYDPWPTALAEHWSKAGGRVQSGLSMLINQALAQVRVFTSGDPTEALSDEPMVLAAMRDAVGATTTAS